MSGIESKRLKRAKASPQTVEIPCPYCSEAIPEPHSGSLFWEVAEINTGVITCPGCSRACLAPRGFKDTK